MIWSEGTAAIFGQLAGFVVDLTHVRIANHVGRAALLRSDGPAGARARAQRTARAAPNPKPPRAEPTVEPYHSPARARAQRLSASASAEPMTSSG